ncbi:MAG: OprO/OprP family phosphate-selective porin [Pseudomonadota bacterium]
MAGAQAADTTDVLLRDGGPRIRLGDAEFALGLRLQTDAVYFDDDITPLDDGADARRLRLTLSGKFSKNWEYKYEYDFKPRETTDAFIKYNTLEHGSFTVGQFALPISLDDQTSSKWVSFIERSLPALTFAPGRLLGLKYNATGEQWMLQTALQFDRIDDEERAGDDPIRYTGRLAFSPVHEPERALHAGVAVIYTDVADSEAADFVRFRSRPEARIDGTPALVDTGNFTADHYWLRTVELAGLWGPWSAQAEWIAAATSGPTDYDFSSYTIQASWFLNGQRMYRFNEAQFDKPRLNANAWELAARLSQVDLTDADLSGGVERNLSLGVNWYPSIVLRFSLNLIEAKLSERTSPDETVRIVALRAQMTF